MLEVALVDLDNPLKADLFAVHELIEHDFAELCPVDHVDQRRAGEVREVQDELLAGCGVKLL